MKPKMAMKIPFFHGDDKEDLLNIKEMIWRFKNSANTTCSATISEDQLPSSGRAWNTFEKAEPIGQMLNNSSWKNTKQKLK